MYPKSSFQKTFTLLRWVFVVCFLFAPRVVGHRHIDAMGPNEANQALASHLAMFHGSGQFPVDERELHFHLTFSLLPLEIPATFSFDFGTFTQFEVAQSSQPKSVECTYLLDRTVASESSDFPVAALVGKNTSHGTNRFRHILFGVWII
jgi:hypothetical protein